MIARVKPRKMTMITTSMVVMARVRVSACMGEMKSKRVEEDNSNGENMREGKDTVNEK